MDAEGIDAFMYPGGFACLLCPESKGVQQSFKQPLRMAAMMDCAAPTPKCFDACVPGRWGNAPTPYTDSCTPLGDDVPGRPRGLPLMAPPAPPTAACVCPAGWGNPPRLIGDLAETGASPLGDFSPGLLPATGVPGMVVQMVSPMAPHFSVVGSMTAKWCCLPRAFLVVLIVRLAHLHKADASASLGLLLSGTFAS